ncbi:transposase [Sagittula sp. NFXS13]
MLAEEFVRYGYRMIIGMLNNSGWHVNYKRVERIWRQEGLKVPHKRPKKGRLWLNETLLHKAVAERTSPFPGRIYPTAFVTGMPRAV